MDLLPWLCCHSLRWKVGKIANSGNLDSCVWSTTKQKHEKNENVASSLASELAVLLGGKRKEVDTFSFDISWFDFSLSTVCLSWYWQVDVSLLACVGGENDRAGEKYLKEANKQEAEETRRGHLEIESVGAKEFSGVASNGKVCVWPGWKRSLKPRREREDSFVIEGHLSCFSFTTSKAKQNAFP